jgi:hypothetical protein
VRSDSHLAYDGKLWTFVPRKDVLDNIFNALLRLVGDNKKLHFLDQVGDYALLDLRTIFTTFADYPTIRRGYPEPLRLRSYSAFQDGTEYNALRA